MVMWIGGCFQDTLAKMKKCLAEMEVCLKCQICGMYIRSWNILEFLEIWKIPKKPVCFMLVLQGVLVYILYHVSSHEICENDLLLKILKCYQWPFFPSQVGCGFHFCLKNWISKPTTWGLPKPLRYKLFIRMKGTWMSQEVSKRLVSGL